MKWFRRLLYFLLVVFILLNIFTAFQAYKLTHFYDTVAVLKKPEQMSSWEKASAIMFGVNAPKKKITDLPSVPYDTFSLVTSDGLRLKGWSFSKTSNDKPGKAVIMFHGHAGNKSGILYEAEAFANLNFRVYLIDFRAHGESEGNVCTIGHDEAKDVKALYDYVKPLYGDSIILWGISMGAATVTKALADYVDIKPLKVILEMPFGSLNNAVKGRLRTMHVPEQPFASLLTFWGGTEHGFWAFNLQPTEYAKKIKCPVLVQWGVHDARVSKSETNLVFQNLPGTKRLVYYQNSGHESLARKEPKKWLENVSNFLASNN